MYRVFPPYVLLILPSLLGCAEQRSETPDFFSKKTGIALCDEATVRNVKISENDYETDFIYAVKISSGKKCIELFYKSVRDNYGVDCDKLTNCEFMSDKSWAYKIEQIDEGVIVFKLNAI